MAVDGLDEEMAAAAAGSPRPPSNHGGSVPRGLAAVPRSSIDHGRYGRMFRQLRPYTPRDATLKKLAQSMVPPPTGVAAAGATAAALQPGENPDIPAGYTYVGQFVDHDITYDPTSVLQRRNDPDGIVNYRTPRFDLDSIYGSGPADHPFLYDNEDPVKLLVGQNHGKGEEREDLPRNTQGRALLGDPRNDVHFILSQLTLAVLRFHNAAVDRLRAGHVAEEDVFAEAQRLTRWHYQWIVVEDFLGRIAGQDVLRKVLVVDPATGARRADLHFYSWKREPYMPVEFSAAAYRFGHSMIRATYVLNAGLEPKHIMLPFVDADPLDHLTGFRPLPKGWKISWNLYFVVDGSSPQLSRRIDAKVTGPLARLPVTIDPEQRAMALLDMLRGRGLGLPSGEAVAAAMGTSRHDLGLTGQTPLWYYILKEAEVDSNGLRLGATGATIVAEVLVGLLAADPSSFLRVDPSWTPELPAEVEGRFTMVDFLRFAGVA